MGYGNPLPSQAKGKKAVAIKRGGQSSYPVRGRRFWRAGWTLAVPPQRTAAPAVFVPVANPPVAPATRVNQWLPDVWKGRQPNENKSIQVQAAV